jgi:hypothetical protein
MHARFSALPPKTTLQRPAGSHPTAGTVRSSFAHPFIAGASPLGFDLDAVKRLEDGGCAAMVIPRRRSRSRCAVSPA